MISKTAIGIAVIVIIAILLVAAYYFIPNNKSNCSIDLIILIPNPGGKATIVGGTHQGDRLKTHSTISGISENLSRPGAKPTMIPVNCNDNLTLNSTNATLSYSSTINKAINTTNTVVLQLLKPLTP